jgi:hypothetical protein
MLIQDYIAVYKSERTQLGQFLQSTRSILHSLAKHALEIEKFANINTENSVETMSRGTRHIALLYHKVCDNQKTLTSRTNIRTVCHNCYKTPFVIRFYGSIRTQ